MYTIIPDPRGQTNGTLVRLSDGACIPFAPDNTDYQEYLKWLEAGNTPLPAEQPE